MAAGRRVGVGVVLGLLGVALVLAAVPGDPGAIRLAGVATLWWFALAAALVSTVTASIFLRPPRNVPAPRSDTRNVPSTGSFANIPSPRSDTIIAAWVAPVVLVSLASRVFAGAAEVPVLALALVSAPLAALLGAAPGEGTGTNRVASVATLAAVGLVLWASLITLGDVAQVLGARRWLAVVLATALALLASAWRARDPGWALGASLGAGTLGVVLAVVVVGAIAATPPWAAWSEVASRPALTFAARSAWVNEGRRFAEPVSVAFTEAHRVTALAPGVYRVVEEVDRRRVTREWRLAAGDALTLRPGDRLVLEAGAQVRFEPGKRVPGAPMSGIVWADPPERHRLSTLVETFGVALTLVGGALALSLRVAAGAPSTARGALAGSALLLLMVLSAVCWGVYGAHAAPELALGAGASAGLVELPALLLQTLAGRALVAATVIALILLFVATTCALRDVGIADGAPGARDAVWTGLLALAAAAGVWPGDAWRVFLAGCGLAGATVIAPRIAGGGRAAELAGSAVGAAAFAGLAAAAGLLPVWAAAPGAYPILLAGPLAWASARAWKVAGIARG